MSFKAINCSLILLVVVIISQGGCGKALQDFNLVSDSQELAMGQQFSTEIEQELKLYDDPEVVRYINDLGQRLAAVSRRPNLTYQIKVVDTDDVNAFAVPGGYLYVNRGLISHAENESELAGVMGHEVGHIVGRHGSKQISKQYGLQFITAVLIGGGDPGLTRQIAAQFAGIGGTLGLLKYGREAEREADTFAVQEMYDAGIDPVGMATFFEKLVALHGAPPSGFQALFSTHPNPQERVDNARELISRLKVKIGLKKDSERFQSIKSRLPAIQQREAEDASQGN